MRLRHRDQDPAGGPTTSDGEPGPDRAELRERADALLAAADDAITRALSRNSAEFLAQNRQAGGQ